MPDKAIIVEWTPNIISSVKIFVRDNAGDQKSKEKFPRC